MKNHNNDELYHYGVLGMKWGVRRTRTTSSNNNKKTKPLSNKEMKSIEDRALKYNRASLQKEYDSYTPEFFEKVWGFSKKEALEASKSERKRVKSLMDFEINGRDAVLDLLDGEFRDYDVRDLEDNIRYRYMSDRLAEKGF